MEVANDLKLAIHKELTELLYRNLALGLISIFVFTSVVYWQLHLYEPTPLLLTWYVLLSVNLFLGLILIYWYYQTKSNPKLLSYHYYLYILGSSLTALFLGLLGSVLMPQGILHQALVIILIVSVVGGAAQGLLSSYLASGAYLILALCPLLIWQFSQILQGHHIYIGIFTATLGDLIYLTAAIHSGHQTIENNIKLKLENINITETLQKQKIKIEFLSEHDMLTNLYNRRYLEDTLITLQKSKKELSIFMFDIDYFKTFNDELGHEAGDIILRELGKLTKSFFRNSDIPFRFGGEEFLIILQGASIEGASQTAEAFRLAVKNQQIQFQNQQLSITISGGIASFPHHGATLHDVINAADKALYKSKNNGRDQIQIGTLIQKKNSTLS